MLQGSREETHQDGRGGGPGEHGYRITGLWMLTYQPGVVQVPWLTLHGQGQRLSGGGVQTFECQGEVVSYFKEPWNGGVRWMIIG